MCYSRLFYEYTEITKNRWKDPYIAHSEKRLRWLKYEAFGNSDNRTAAFNIRHAHICNRNLQGKLGTQLSYFSNVHGKHCSEIENKQMKLWLEMRRREDHISNTSHSRISHYQSQKKLLPKRNNLEENLKPFSTHKDYTVFHHMEAQTRMPIEKVATGRWAVGEEIRITPYVEMLRFDRKRKKEVIVISTRKDNSLRSGNQVYGSDLTVCVKKS